MQAADQLDTHWLHQWRKWGRLGPRPAKELGTPWVCASKEIEGALGLHQQRKWVVNVLDEVHNPGLRDAIKNYSQWPTIPQGPRLASLSPVLIALPHGASDGPHSSMM
eukprot:1161354-Pelagomonas_calceolata.AAC.3